MRGTARTLAATVALTVTVPATLSACTEQQEPVTLPSLTPSTATPTSTTGMTDEEQIRAIYAGYARGLHRAERIKSDDERRAYLAQWLVDPALTDRVKGAEEFRKAGYRTEGTPEPHVARTSISGQTGTVHGCTDEGPLLTKNVKTGESRHGSGIWRVFTLKRTRNGWRIFAVEVGKKLCDPDKY